MAVLPIVKYPDPRLREVSKPIGEVTDELRSLVEDMKETMYASEGAGLAAIQVGSPLRLFIVDAFLKTEDSKAEPFVFCNPEIVSKGGKQDADEGCLSFPGVFVPVSRAARVTVRGTNLEGEPVEMTGEAILARAFQHEMDHLDGRLIIDHVGRLKRRFIDKKMKRASQEDAVS
jgi:peptide deformylase